MDSEVVSTSSASELRRQAGRAAVAFGLWLRLAFVGAGTLIAGLLLLLDDPARPLLTLALVVGGGVLATVGWRRAARILNAADEDAVRDDAASPAIPALRAIPEGSGRSLR